MQKNNSNKLVFLLLILLFTSFLIIFSLLKDKNKTQSGTIKPNNPSVNTKPSSKCGIENCHGMDIKCGKNVVEMCTDMYEIGDSCRPYATCEVTENGCELVTTDIFIKCKSCVQNCINTFKNIPQENSGFMDIFECEQKCLSPEVGGYLPD